jgi:hypothetical protein
MGTAAAGCGADMATLLAWPGTFLALLFCAACLCFPQLKRPSCPDHPGRCCCGASPRATPLPTWRALKTLSHSPPCGTGAVQAGSRLPYVLLVSRACASLCCMPSAGQRRRLHFLLRRQPATCCHLSLHNHFLSLSQLPCPLSTALLQQPALDSARPGGGPCGDCRWRVCRLDNPGPLLGGALLKCLPVAAEL